MTSILAAANTTVVIMVFMLMQSKLVLDPTQSEDLAIEVARVFVKKGLTLATAESCTGGAIGAALTALPGSSKWFNGGIISYSNGAKINLLGVEAEAIKAHGAVSKEVVEAMAIGGCQAMAASVCVAVSGIAGPDGGTTEKPVGSVWIAWSQDGLVVTSQLHHFQGSRKKIQSEAVCMALKGLISQ